MPKKILLVIKSPPYGSSRASEGFRIATAMIAMDILPRLLFIDDGVYCLIKNQKPDSPDLEMHYERLKTLADLAGLYAAKESMAKRRLELADLDNSLHVKMVDFDEATEQLIESESVLTF